MDFPTIIKWTSPFSILGLLDGIFHLYLHLINILKANSGYPDQMPHSVDYIQ